MKVDFSKMSFSEKLMYSTVRIQTEYPDGSKGSGTGFYVSFLMNSETAQSILCVVTNKHVVKGATKIKMALPMTNVEMEEGVQWIIMDFCDELIYDHPSEDLCAINITAIANIVQKEDKKLIACSIPLTLVPSQEILDNLSAMEDIVMVGYPDGIWDEVNNKPLFRKGVTATHPKYNFNGRNEFIIDAACFNGSSGSPVFILNEGMYSVKNEGSYIGNRIYFMGILYGGPQHLSQVHQMKAIPGVFSAIPNNLGCVIKSNALYQLEEVVKNHQEPDTLRHLGII